MTKMNIFLLALCFFRHLNDILEMNNGNIKNRELNLQIILLNKNCKKLLRTIEDKQFLNFQKTITIHKNIIGDLITSLQKYSQINSKLISYKYILRKIMKRDLKEFFRYGILKQLRFIEWRKEIKSMPLKNRMRVESFFKLNSLN